MKIADRRSVHWRATSAATWEAGKPAPMCSALSVFVVDDEPLAIRRIAAILDSAPHITVAGTAWDGESAVDVIRGARPDILLMDISLPGMSGFDVISALGDGYAPAVIFTTAYDQYAVDAFRTGAIDYLLKPIEAERLLASVERARVHLLAKDASERIRELDVALTQLRANQTHGSQRSSYASELWYSERHGVTRVPLQSVEWIEAEGDYVRVHTTTRSYFIRESISRLAERLDPAIFRRVHRSAIVRLGGVKRVWRSSNGGLMIGMSDGSTVAVGRTYGDAVRNFAETMGLVGAGLYEG